MFYNLRTEKTLNTFPQKIQKIYRNKKIRDFLPSTPSWSHGRLASFFSQKYFPFSKMDKKNVHFSKPDSLLCKKGCLSFPY